MSREVLLSISFRNQDIWYAELECCADGAMLGDKLEAAEAALARWVSAELVAFHLEDSRLGRAGVLAVSALIRRQRQRCRKFVLVGVHGLDRSRFRRLLRRGGGLPPWTIENDYQAAKEWLVSPTS